MKKTITFKIIALALYFILSGIILKAQTDDTNFPVPNNQVYAVKYDSVSNNVFAGGYFTFFGGSARQRFAVMNATTGALKTWVATFDAAIWDFYVVNDFLYVSGDFTLVNGSSRNHIAKFKISTQTLQPWNPGLPNTSTRGLEFLNGKLYVASLGGSISRIDTSSAATIDSWQPLTSGNPIALKIVGNYLYLGGSFSSIDGVARANIAAFDISTPIPTLDPWAPEADDMVLGLDYYNGYIFATGNFGVIGGAALKYLAEINDAPSGLSTATSWNPNPAYMGYKVKVKGKQLYYADNQSQLFEVYLPTHTNTSWLTIISANIGYSVIGMDLSATKIFIGGGWNLTVAGVAKPYFAAICVNPYHPIINPLSFITNPSDVCAGQTSVVPFELDPNSGAISYTWSNTLAGISVSNSTKDSVSMNFSGAGAASNTVSAYGTNGCLNTNTVTATVNVYTFSVPITTNTTSITCGDSVDLNSSDNYLGSGTLSYTWSPATGLNATNVYKVTSGAKATTTYSLHVVSSDGCSSNDTQTIQVLPFNLSTSSDLGSILCSTKDTLRVTNDYPGYGTVTYTWTPGASLSNANSSRPTANPIVSTTYTVTASATDGCLATAQTQFINVNDISVTAGSNSGSITCGDATILSSNNTYPGNGTVTYTWSPVTGLSNANVSGPGADPIATTTYTLNISTPEGCQGSDQVTLIVNPLQVNVTNAVSAGCHQPVVLSTSANTSNSNLTYSWTPSTGLSSTTAASPTATIGVNTVYNVTMSLPLSGCASANNSVSMSLAPPAGLQICMVTVDSASTHNIVYWDKTGMPAIDSFRIYREITTGVYGIVGTVHYNALSEFHDFGANPNVTTYRYKISALDSCGNESVLSNYHNTVYIISVGNGQYTWNPGYTIEPSTNPVNNYLLMRDDNNNGSWHQVGSTSGSQNTLADPQWASYPNANWQVETSWNISCTPTLRQSNGTLSAIVKSKSNISNNRTTAVKNTETTFAVYPNPTGGNVTLDLSSITTGKINIKITSVIGEEVYNETLQQVNGKHTVDLSKYQNGTYLVQITGTNTSVVKRIIKN